MNELNNILFITQIMLYSKISSAYSILMKLTKITSFMTQTPCGLGLPLMVETLEMQPPFICVRNRKRRLNRIELLEYMHILAPACEVVLSLCCFEICKPEVSQNHLSCFAHYDINCVCEHYT